jgi:heat shock protein HslJ
MASEEAYLTALRHSDRIARDGDSLVVSGPESSLRFERLVPVPEAALVDTAWVLGRLIDGDTSVQAGGEPATLELRSDGTFTGSTGCRQLTGTFVIRGDEILATRMSADGHCQAGLAEQDAHVVGVLGDGFTVTIDGDGLTLTAMGSLGLSYRSA